MTDILNQMKNALQYSPHYSSFVFVTIGYVTSENSHLYTKLDTDIILLDLNSYNDTDIHTKNYRLLASR